MIGKLLGIIDSFGSGHLILNVAGVGYLVHTSSRTLSQIGQPGDNASLLIETLVREDAITLYGFATSQEQAWFRLLTSVQGVGAKAALAILTVCPEDRLPMIIASQDKAALTQADGVGPKLATRILTELKDKAGKMDLSPSPVSTPVNQPVDKSQTAGVDNDAVAALIGLGYARADAYQAVMKAKSEANDNESLQGIIKLALQNLAG